MGFLDCLGRGEGGRGCQVSQFVAGGPGGSLCVETSQSVSQSVGVFSFHLGRVLTGGGGVVVMISRSLQSSSDPHVSRARL